jgi:uncharacterized protein involved in exopolysaccharide biosynthesis
MLEGEWDGDGEELSVFAIGALLVRNRGRILRWAIAGAVVALALSWTRPALFRASASFIPQGADPGRSSLASLAGQFGVSLPVGSAQALTPDFYLRLLRSRELLVRIARDTLAVPELGNRRMAVEDLLDIGPGPAKSREEAAVDVLSRRISAGANKATSVVEFGVGMEWPSVSLAIATTLLDGVNEFNLRTRRDQASAERKFVEARLAVASAELRAAEDRLQQFLQTNRQFVSPDLQFTKERLQRDVSLRQQVFTSLTQAYEDVRMREVRDTPVITIIDQPNVPTKAEPRGRAIRTALGLVLGAAVGALLVFLGEVIAKRRAEGDPSADEFLNAVGEVKGEVLRRVRRLGGRASA